MLWASHLINNEHKKFYINTFMLSITPNKKGGKNERNYERT